MLLHGGLDICSWGFGCFGMCFTVLGRYFTHGFV